MLVVLQISKILFKTFIIILLITIPFYSNTYYVDKNHPSANNSNPGTINLPWLTIQHAASNLVSGDTVYIRAGTYNERIAPQNSGSVNNFIVYMAYPNETVTVDGNGLSLQEYEGLIDIIQKSYIKISGLRIINSGSIHDNFGIAVEGSNHIIIENNYTYNTFSSGIIVWGSENVIVDNNEVELACNGGAGSTNECISVGETNMFEIKNNYVHDGNSIRGEGIDAKDGSSNGEVCGNHVRNIMSVGIYVDAWDKHTYNIDVYQNLIHDIAGDGISIGSEEGGLLENIRVYNNIVYHNLWVGISIHNCCISTHPLNNIQVINNTFYDNGLGSWGGGILNENPQAQNVIIRNNICSDNLSFQIALEGVSPSIVTIDHNLIDGYRGYTGELYGDDPVIGNPQFSNSSQSDFHLLQNSPAIDYGSSQLAPATDYDGNARPQGPGFDLGAYEYIQTVGIDDKNSLHLTEFKLYQNYPNPFNAETQIKYYLTSRSFVSLKIYSALGEEIDELVNMEKVRGYHGVIFKNFRLSSGVYFCVLNAESLEGENRFRNAKKMIMMK